MEWLRFLKRPGGFLPLAMSAAALATVLVHVLMHGAAREADEGAAAHLFQLLMAVQAPIVIGYFAFKARESLGGAFAVLAIQAAAAALALAPVFLLGL